VERDERAVLVVENSQSVAQMVAMYLGERCGRECQVVRTLAQARSALKARPAREWLGAVVNLELPDAKDEEIVTLTLSQGVPTIVLTGTFSEAKRQRILRHDIVDYCLKGKSGIEALVKVFERLQRNPALKLLVVDDMQGSRAQQLRFLASQRFEALHAEDRQEALALVREHPELSVVLVSLSSESEALGLISELRERASPDDLAIVGVAVEPEEHAPAHYLKAGASDFLARPFEKEEYICRVYGALDRVESMRRIKQLAFQDNLTGVANRLAFFKQVPDLLSEALDERGKPALALLSIDELQRINSVHGYSAGDLMLQSVARAMTSQLGPDTMCARFSGEQFSVFVRDAGQGTLSKLFEKLRAAVERTSVVHEGVTLTATVSCGVVACEADESIDSFLNSADSALEEAEAQGGNRVVVHV
jgi:diguanylate cyclase (GGDEF)-like protein